jgi:hypothetical protein
MLCNISTRLWLNPFIFLQLVSSCDSIDLIFVMPRPRYVVSPSSFGNARMCRVQMIQGLDAHL